MSENKYEPKSEQKKEIVQESGSEKFKFELKDLASAEEYLEWKKTVPAQFRSVVEAEIKGNKNSKSQTGLILTDQFLDTLSECLNSRSFAGTEKIDKKVTNLLAPLEKIETKGGYINVFETLSNSGTSWNLRRRIFETQIKPALQWLAEKDLADITEKTNQQQTEESAVEDESQQKKSDENDVPPDSENARSSMENGMEKKEGEPNAIFSVKPFYGGYYKQQMFDAFDPATCKWKKAENIFEPHPDEALQQPLETRILHGKICGNQPLAIPLPYDWILENGSFQSDAPDGSVEIKKNQEGLSYLHIHAEGVFNYQMKIGPRQTMEDREKFSQLEIFGELAGELESEIENLKKQNFPKMKLLREIVKLVRKHLVYSNNSEAWAAYAGKPEEFFKKLWERREADCFVANTLALRALFEVDKSARFVGGYFIKEKNIEGDAVMHSGNGHAWLEVWDDMSGRAVRLDATPKGDPNVDEEQQEKELDGENGEGDYGESEDELMSEEKLKEKIKEMQGQKEKKERTKSNPVDLEESRFAGLAECSPEQAREFLKALDRVREIKDERGIPISDLLKEEWKKIITERKVEMADYRGPVRMDEGDVLEDPVSALIDIRSREFNPTGFEKLEIEEKIETDFGGINIYFSFDLSGSMNESDAASGRRKADVQRDTALLFADSIMQCSYVSRQQNGNSDLLPIKIMVTLASDTGDVSLHLTDKWGPKEQWAFYSALNRLAKGGTPTHQTLQLIERDFDKEISDLKDKATAKEKMPIHYTAEISDGDPNDFDKTEKMHESLKKKGMTVRSYCIGGQSASADAAPSLRSFSDLPEILSKDIIGQFKKLHPKRIK